MSGAAHHVHHPRLMTPRRLAHRRDLRGSASHRRRVAYRLPKSRRKSEMVHRREAFRIQFMPHIQR